MRISRSLYQAVQANRPRLQTIYSPTPAFLATHLSKTSSTRDSASLYLLSTSLDSSTLSPLISTLQAHLIHSIGSWSASPPTAEPTLSIATFPKAHIWRSDLSGRPPVEVGRNYRPRKGPPPVEDAKGRNVEDLEMVRESGEGWEGMWEAELGVEEIADLKGVEARSLIVLGDGAPRPVLRGLQKMFPTASTMGVMTAPTPFITGRPHTLVHNSQFYSSGSIGLALPYDVAPAVDFGLERMTPPYSIESVRGNMLLSFKGGVNPTQMLVSAIQKRGGKGITKEEEFFLALLDSTGEASEVVKILSGDPSRGALSLDMEDGLVPGQSVQFMQRRAGSISTPAGFSFTALPKADDVPNPQVGEPRVEDGVFAGYSENGLIMSRNGKISLCSAGGASVRAVY